ncbi:MAG: Glutamine amidotransferase of anthranilate synthase [Candidatus Daviesbacteria bacterium GW2011_GWF2_38_6]|uniref:Glutamine amidotransferase of anthranilate synthase n=1 Tax=Candidatus Daviesbacteria bacterium GW2011_GWF2_38_6 TaxID=1618432 RepID=A0A0G0KEN6_9BACT|nr:MAG: Glutamine amidotransferase of anthranilate synthase [Candidatus Daviesbacteria bacterium GW2011_GWF2_38_6]
MKILIIDNYDSFTFNLYQYAGEILKDSGKDFAIDVVRNDQISLEGIKKRKYDRVIISPGPGDPSDSAAEKLSSNWVKKFLYWGFVWGCRAWHIILEEE